MGVEMPKCIVCGSRADDIVYDKIDEKWEFVCKRHISQDRDLVVPRHMIEQLIGGF